jgi:hypothetical protein
MLKVIDAIEGSGFPLGFRCSETNHLSPVKLGQEGHDSIIVEPSNGADDVMQIF